MAGGCDDSCLPGLTPEQANTLMQAQLYALQNKINTPVPVAKQWIGGISNTVVALGGAAFAALLIGKSLR
jgi:hypothetical protein